MLLTIILSTLGSCSLTYKGFTVNEYFPHFTDHPSPVKYPFLPEKKEPPVWLTFHVEHILYFLLFCDHENPRPLHLSTAYHTEMPAAAKQDFVPLMPWCMSFCLVFSFLFLHLGVKSLQWSEGVATGRLDYKENMQAGTSFEWVFRECSKLCVHKTGLSFLIPGKYKTLINKKLLKER